MNPYSSNVCEVATRDVSRDVSLQQCAAKTMAVVRNKLPSTTQLRHQSKCLKSTSLLLVHKLVNVLKSGEYDCTRVRF